MGTIKDFFQRDGMVPVVRDRLKSLVIEGAILYAVFLSILADIPSCPLALDESKAANRSPTSDSEQRISSGQVGCREVAPGVEWVDEIY